LFSSFRSFLTNEDIFFNFGPKGRSVPIRQEGNSGLCFGPLLCPHRRCFPLLIDSPFLWRRPTRRILMVTDLLRNDVGAAFLSYLRRFCKKTWEAVFPSGSRFPFLFLCGTASSVVFFFPLPFSRQCAFCSLTFCWCFFRMRTVAMMCAFSLLETHDPRRNSDQLPAPVQETFVWGRVLGGGGVPFFCGAGGFYFLPRTASRRLRRLQGLSHVDEPFFQAGNAFFHNRPAIRFSFLP